mgnify:CR=1 FL=1
MPCSKDYIILWNIDLPSYRPTPNISHLKALLVRNPEHVRFELYLVLLLRRVNIEVKELEGGEKGMFFCNISDSVTICVFYDCHPI